MEHLSACLKLEELIDFCWVKTAEFTPLWLPQILQVIKIIDTDEVRVYWREIQYVAFMLYVSILLTTTEQLLYTQNILEMLFLTDCLEDTFKDELLNIDIKEKLEFGLIGFHMKLILHF